MTELYFKTREELEGQGMLRKIPCPVLSRHMGLSRYSKSGKFIDWTNSENAYWDYGRPVKVIRDLEYPFAYRWKKFWYPNHAVTDEWFFSRYPEFFEEK